MMYRRISGVRYAPSRARVSQLLPVAFAAFTKINDLQARPSVKMPAAFEDRAAFEGRACFL